jgi:hypothetical protein
MNDSDRYMSDYQTQWRCSTLDENQELGIKNEKKRPLILPKKLWEQGPLAGIRAGTNV